MAPEEEIEILLGEIPRATSAPPQFEDYQQALGSPLLHAKARLAVSHCDPTPFPADYPSNKLPSVLSDSCVSNFHPSGLLLHQRMSQRFQQSCPQSPLPPQQHFHSFESNRELNGNGNQISHQFSYDEDPIYSALANLSLNCAPDPSQSFPGEFNGYTHGRFVVESSERSNSEPCENMFSFPVDDGATAELHQRLIREQSPDWNSTVRATPVDRRSMRYFQMQQQSLSEDRGLPQHSQAPILPLAMPKQSARRDFRGSDLPEELQYDCQLLAYIHQHKQSVDMHHQQFQRLQLPEQQSALYASFYNQVGGTLGHYQYSNYFPAIPVPGIPQQPSDQQNQAGAMAPVLQAGWSHAATSSVMGLTDDYCSYYAHGHCIQGDACPFLHLHNLRENGGASWKETLPGAPGGQAERLGPFLPNKILHRRSLQRNGDHEAVAFVPGKRKTIVENGHPAANGNGVPTLAENLQLLVMEDDRMRPSQQLMKFTTLEEVEGRIYNVAKDQHGCRFLQRKFDEGKPEDVQKIFEEIKGHILELMTDPFGNYLVQKLLEVCKDAYRMEILEAVTKQDDLVAISLNMHGTRAVQKLIETLQTPQQVSLVISSLKQGVVSLIKDINGNHVVQRCLQHLSIEDSQFIFDAAASHCVEIASHRHGCCVLQRCVDFASGLQRQYLVAQIAANALTLAQDPFGNYVVQYILELGLPWASAEIMSRLEGSYPHLAMQKFSSNVVEKCLKLATEDNKACIVKELIASSVLGQLLQDPYANYVIQSALQVTKGPLHMSLFDAIRPHVPVLRSSPYGKRILSRTHLKK